MGRPKRVSWTTTASELGVEYVRSRRVLRLFGSWRGNQLPPVEIPVDRLCEKLSIEPRELGSPEVYLLFAGGHDRVGGGLGDLVGTFATEDDGLQAFRRLQVHHPAFGGWAELAGVNGFGRVRQVCWFGSADDRRPLRPQRSGEVVALANSRRRLRRLVGAAGERGTDDVASS